MPPPPYRRPIITEDEAVKALPRVVPRTKATPIPTPSIFDEPTYCLKVNKAWAGHFLGVILIGLNQPDTWKPDETHDIEWARNEVVEWVAKFLTENDCMPCCDETNELLLQVVNNLVTIITQNTTIIDNSQTIIDNGDTVIEQNETVVEQNYEQIINQYFEESNTYTQNSYDQRTFNFMLYDGTNESVGPNVPDDFDGEGDAAGDGALCAAIDRYQTSALFQYTNNINGVARFVGVSSAALAGLLVAQSVWTVGISAAFGVAVAAAGAAFGGAVIAWNNSVNDPEARLQARCCMFDNLKGQAVTFEVFKASMTDCSFEVGTNESNVAAALHTQNQDQGNYLAFVRALSEAQGTGDATNCACGCDDDIVLEDFSGTGCVITPMGNCIYRFSQSTVTPTASPPEGRRYFSFRDIGLRCLKVEFAPEPYPGPSTGGCTVIGCCGQADYNGDNFGGGFAPTTLISVNWWRGGDLTEPQYYKITLQDMEA